MPRGAVDFESFVQKTQARTQAESSGIETEASVAVSVEQELELNRRKAHTLLEALKEGLALLPAAEQGVTLMLHPDDIARIEQAFGADECAKRHWRLQSDPTLSPGELQLATELSSIDLTLSGRIDQLLRNFLRDNASQKPASQDSRP